VVTPAFDAAVGERCARESIAGGGKSRWPKIKSLSREGREEAMAARASGRSDRFDQGALPPLTQNSPDSLIEIPQASRPLSRS
jgi:hypothetical protein